MTTPTQIRPISSTDVPVQDSAASPIRLQPWGSLRLLGSGRHPGVFQDGVEVRHAL